MMLLGCIIVRMSNLVASCLIPLKKEYNMQMCQFEFTCLNKREAHIFYSNISYLNRLIHT